jgi:hypothetical protein
MPRRVLDMYDSAFSRGFLKTASGPSELSRSFSLSKRYNKVMRVTQHRGMMESPNGPSGISPPTPHGRAAWRRNTLQVRGPGNSPPSRGLYLGPPP